MNIRESNNLDHDAIYRLHLDAFGPPEGASVAQLATDLLQDKSAQPLISLVAEENDQLVGHIIFSAVHIEGQEQKPGAYILAPLAVIKDYQRKGIGTLLIRRGLELLKARSASLVFVLGDPNYYVRSGFRLSERLKPPYELAYPEAWMVQALTPGILENATGTIKCAKTLSAPEHW